MLHQYLREAQFLLEEGASPQQVDAVVRGLGFPMGPFQMGDLAGLDVGWRIRKGKHAIAPPVGRYSKVSDELCELGRFGQKTGAGYYRYENGDRTPVPDPSVDELIARVAREAGVERRAVSDDEILKRCMYPLINEAAKILAEGFPAWRGGPLRWADSIGLRSIVDDLLAFERVHGEAWTPAPLLRELAESGGTFGTWKRPAPGAAHETETKETAHA
jgi:3-hydroxyacyl-CoA dehydrogenase